MIKENSKIILKMVYSFKTDSEIYLPVIGCYIRDVFY